MAITRVRSKSHTLLLIQSASSFSTIVSLVSQTLTDALLRTTKLFSAITRARIKAHTTPNTECVTILYIRRKTHINALEFLAIDAAAWTMLGLQT